MIENYRKTRKTHSRGTRVLQPSASDVLEGTLYFVTDEGVIEQSNGIIWQSYSGTSSASSIANNPILIPSIDGEDGIDGFPGLRGLDGIVGAAGIQGPRGLNGLDGIDSENNEIIIQGPLAGNTFDNFFADDLIFTQNKTIHRNTIDGSDNGYTGISAGGDPGGGLNRSSSFFLYGNESSFFPGGVIIAPGNVAGSRIELWRNNSAQALTVDGPTGNVGVGTITVPSLLTVAGLINLKNYTVATLPAATRGDIAYVTDALAPSFLAVLVGGGAVVTPCFYNGTNWVGF